MKKISILFSISVVVLLFSALVYADSNGIWHEVENIKGGTIGGDELAFTNNFIFKNRVDFLRKTYILGDVGVKTTIPSVELEVNGTIKAKRILADNFRSIRCPKALAIVGLDTNGDLICEKMVMK